MILKNVYKLKKTGIYVNEDFSEETLKKRAELYPIVKKHRAAGKFAFIKIDEIVIREWKK